MRRTPILVLALAAGCHHESPFLSDDVDLNLNFSDEDPNDNLNSPYVRGTQVRVYVHHPEDDNLAGWSLESDRSDVLMRAVANDGPHPSADFIAVEEGTATLTAVDEGGDVQASAEARVVLPDRAQVIAHGPLLIGREESEATLDGEVHLLANGTATFLIQWWRSGEQLHGNGVLAAPALAPLLTEPRQSFLFENREWLTLTAGPDPAAQDVPLVADGIQVGTLRVVTVAETDIASIGIEGQNESEFESGDSLTALGVAYDAGGAPIYGVTFAWELDGAPVYGDDGDLFRYTYEPGHVRALTANAAGQSTTAMIHADQGMIGSSNATGCALAPGRAPDGLAGLACLACAGLCLALNRRRCS